MPRFIVNTNARPNGDHEVHNITVGCSHLPEPSNQMDVGAHPDCHFAVAKAKETFLKSNGCAYCCPTCNTG